MNRNSNTKLTSIRFSGLIGVYGLIPISAILVIIDIFLFDHYLQKTLLTSPEQYPIFLVFFRYPHIIAGLFAYTHKKYVDTYLPRIKKATILIGLSFLILLPLFGKWFFAGYEIWTVKHALGQQLGLTRKFLGGGGTDHRIWSFCFFLLGLILYFFVTIKFIAKIDFHEIEIFLMIILLIITFYTLRLLKLKNNDYGGYYLVCNYMMIVSAFIFVKLNYPFFFLLIPRVIHDITAFQFYSVHDQNLQNASNGIPIYRAFRWTKIPVLFLCPLLSICLGLPIVASIYFGGSGIVFYLMGMIGLFHYYTDSFTWKRDSISQPFIPIQYPHKI